MVADIIIDAKLAMASFNGRLLYTVVQTGDKVSKTRRQPPPHPTPGRTLLDGTAITLEILKPATGLRRGLRPKGSHPEKL